jgi:hypothetical protein
MPSQYPRIYREPAIEANEIREKAVPGAKRSRMMLVSCTESGDWHRVENVGEMLAHFAFAPEQPRARRSLHRWIMKASFSIILLAVAAGAGAFGHVVMTRANDFFTPPTVAPAVSAPTTAATTMATASTPPVVAAPPLAATAIAATSTAPVVTPQEAPAPATISLEEGVGRAVNQIRASLPRQIDALVSVVGVKNEGTRIIYENKIAMDGAKINNTKKAKMTEQIIANTCNSPGPRKLLELGVAFRYLYIDMKEKPVMIADVTKQNCV